MSVLFFMLLPSISCVFEPGWHTLKYSNSKCWSQIEHSSAKLRYGMQWCIWMQFITDFAFLSAEHVSSWWDAESVHEHHIRPSLIALISLRMSFLLHYSHFPTTVCPIPPFFSFPDVCIIIHNLKQRSCRYDSTTWSVQKTFAWKCLRRGAGWGGGIRLPPALKSLSCSKSCVTHWAGSCLTFSNANDGQRWKPQIGPFRSSVWCLVRPCSCWRPWSFSCPPPSLLCAAVIGTDVLLASHRATFP